MNACMRGNEYWEFMGQESEKVAAQEAERVKWIHALVDVQWEDLIKDPTKFDGPPIGPRVPPVAMCGQLEGSDVPIRNMDDIINNLACYALATRAL